MCPRLEPCLNSCPRRSVEGAVCSLIFPSFQNFAQPCASHAQVCILDSLLTSKSRQRKFARVLFCFSTFIRVRIQDSWCQHGPRNACKARGLIWHLPRPPCTTGGLPILSLSVHLSLSINALLQAPRGRPRGAPGRGRAPPHPRPLLVAYVAQAPFCPRCPFEQNTRETFAFA